MRGLDPADVLTRIKDDPGDALIAAVGRLARCGAVRYVCGYDFWQDCADMQMSTFI